MAKGSRERRRSRRVPVEIQIRYETADGFFQDYIRNLSLGGIFIQTPQPLPMNTKLKVQFSLPDMPVPIVADGVVVHTLRVGQAKNASACGMGIKFAELEPSSKQELEAYLQSSKKSPAP